MENNPAHIHIKVCTDYSEQQLEVAANSYRNLMCLIKDQVYIDGFGECGGMGRCGTCMVEVLNNNTFPVSLERNEEATLKKMGVLSPAIRLSCQMLITDALDNIELKVTEL